MGPHPSTYSVGSQSFIDSEVFGGISNTEILAQPLAHPQSRLPVPRAYIYERPREKSRFNWMFRLNPVRFPYLVVSRRQLHRSFETTAEDDQRSLTTGLYDVYAVMRPDMFHRALTQSIYHWSLYCNGHYYHLYKLEKVNGAQTILKDEDLSSKESPDYESHRSHPSVPLMAYHLGKTDYHPDQIHKIAEWVIRRMGLYDLFKSNCQHFVFSLAVRIICCRRDTTVFLGHTLQIVDQDRLRRIPRPRHANTNPLPRNGFYTGFQLAAPNEDTNGWLRQFMRQTTIDLTSWQLRFFWNYGVNDKLPHNILECSLWRRHFLIFLCFSPILRNKLLRSTSAQPSTDDGNRIAIYSVAPGLLMIFFHIDVLVFSMG
ncbi:hypothetical protein BDV26DRAFT_296509 [Aspergillus bertholletiae]|uniref:PPPDE domain-containing protein n=1 Tax=Aspergillus bertholletiae TaxID=1226010 RepID=A0A5N7AYF5_9EURO|nr:hypothetical protein BDV26DRAFT_296509 [Aspergillus bertholletiae]